MRLKHLHSIRGIWHAVFVDVGAFDAWLANRTFVATEEFTVADILMTHVLSAGSTDQALLQPHTHVRSYLTRCLDRPAWKRTFDAYCKRVEAA